MMKRKHFVMKLQNSAENRERTHPLQRASRPPSGIVEVRSRHYPTELDAPDWFSWGNLPPEAHSALAARICRNSFLRWLHLSPIGE